VYTSPAISRNIRTAPKPRPPTVHCSRSIFRWTPARKPMATPIPTMTKIMDRETVLGLIGFWSPSCPARLPLDRPTTCTNC